MAKSISEEELQLRKRARRRLIGAIALVTIVAVFLPMALDHEPKPLNQDIDIRIPSPGSGTFTSKLAPMPDAKSVAKPASETPVRPPTSVRGDASKAAAAPAAKSAAEAQTPPAFDTEAAPPKKPAAEQPTTQAKPVAKPPAKSASAPTAADHAQRAENSAGGYVVQVAALNDADKAKQMQEQMAAAGVKSYTEVVPVVKGEVTRVRAGPFASRDEAEKIRDQLKGMGLNGNIVAK
jgi:DedD protein